VLLRLDALLSGGGATYDYDTISVEHVLPQTPEPNSEWSRWFPITRERESYVHALGNLVLLTRKKNSSASNYEFDRKKSAYFTKGGVSPFALTTQVLSHATWTPEIVDRRQELLLKILRDHWRLEGSVPSIFVSQSPSVGDGTWRDDVLEALRRLNSRAALAKIYAEVKSLRQAMNRSVPENYDAIVRRTLEENSSDSSAYRGGPDLFQMAEEPGAGVWSLRR
jgi:hypothetical protein